VAAVGQRLFQQPGVAKPVAQLLLQRVELHTGGGKEGEVGSGVAGPGPARCRYSLTFVLAGRLEPAKSISTLML
jgi:hypothetical protein